MRKTATVVALLAAALAAPHPPAHAAEAGAGAPLVMSLSALAVESLANNRSLEVERFGPPLARTFEQAAESAFDTTLDAKLSGTLLRTPQAPDGTLTDSDAERLQLGVTRALPSGTTLGVDFDGARAGSPDSATTRVGVSLTQALLQGRGSDVNLVAVRQARIDTAVSQSELRGFAESLVAQVEQAGWDYLLAVGRVTIVERSLSLAEAQLAEVRERIAVGRLAEIELAAAEAEVAVRREALINTRSAREIARLRLLQLVNPAGAAPLDREVTITDAPTPPDEDPAPVADHVALALKRRPELEQARLQLERGDLELVQTRNGLLPRLDLFISLGATGYAASFVDSLSPGDGRDLSAGLTLTLPIGNRAARAADERATLSRQRAGVALENLAQLVEVDVRGAWIEAARLREQIAATAATRRLQEKKVLAESEKFRVGKSTTFLVGQAQRDLLQAENDYVTALAGLLKAVVDCYRLEGTLLERRGIAVAGR
jgi:outer membrane protein TolC